MSMKLEILSIVIPRNIRKEEIRELLNKYYKDKLRGLNISCTVDKIYITINLRNSEDSIREQIGTFCCSIRNG